MKYQVSASIKTKDSPDWQEVKVEIEVDSMTEAYDKFIQSYELETTFDNLAIFSPPDEALNKIVQLSEEMGLYDMDYNLKNCKRIKKCQK